MAYGIYVAKRDEKNSFVFIYTDFNGSRYHPPLSLNTLKLRNKSIPFYT